MGSVVSDGVRASTATIVCVRYFIFSSADVVVGDDDDAFIRKLLIWQSYEIPYTNYEKMTQWNFIFVICHFSYSQHTDCICSMPYIPIYFSDPNSITHSTAYALSLFPSAIVFVRVSLYHLSIFIFIFIKWKFTIKFIAKYEDALFFIRDIFRPTINWSDMIIWQISAKQYHHNWIWIVSWKFFSQNHLLKLTVNHMLLQPMMLMRWVATHWLCVFPSWFNWF